MSVRKVEGVLADVDVIAVGAVKGIKAGVSIIGYRFNGVYDNFLGQEAVELVDQLQAPAVIQFLGKIKMRHKITGVYSCVGASATGDGDTLSLTVFSRWLLQQQGQGILDNFLHTDILRLDLPTEKRSTIKCQAHEVSHGLLQVFQFLHHQGSVFLIGDTKPL